MKQNQPLGRGKGAGGGGEESGDTGEGWRFCCCFLPDFSDDMPAVSLGQDPCNRSLESGSLASTGVWVRRLRSWQQRRDGEMKTVVAGGGGKAGRGGA